MEQTDGGDGDRKRGQSDEMPAADEVEAPSDGAKKQCTSWPSIDNRFDM